jgi:hypothetical protein
MKQFKKVTNYNEVYYLLLSYSTIILLYFIFFSPYTYTNPESAMHTLVSLIEVQAIVITIQLSISILAIERGTSLISHKAINEFQESKIVCSVIILYILSIIFDLWLLKSIDAEILLYQTEYTTTKIIAKEIIEPLFSWAYRLGIFCLLISIPYSMEVSNLIIPTKIIEKFSKKIIRYNIINCVPGDNADPIKPIIDTIISSARNNDEGCLRPGLRCIEGRIKAIYQDFDLLEYDKLFDLLFFHLKRLFVIVISKQNDFSCYNILLSLKNYGILFLNIENKYIFNWDEIYGMGNEKLIESLSKIFNVKWIMNEKIEKNEDGRAIKVFAEKRTFSLKLNDKKTELVLEIDNVEIDRFISKMENDKLNVYEDDELREIGPRWAADSIRMLGIIAIENGRENLLNETVKCLRELGLKAALHINGPIETALYYVIKSITDISIYARKNNLYPLVIIESLEMILSECKCLDNIAENGTTSIRLFAINAAEVMKPNEMYHATRSLINLINIYEKQGKFEIKQKMLDDIYEIRLKAIDYYIYDVAKLSKNTLDKFNYIYETPSTSKLMNIYQ